MKERIGELLKILKDQRASIGKNLILPEEYSSADPVMRSRMERNAGYFQNISFYNEVLYEKALNGFKDLSNVFKEISTFLEDPNFLFARNEKRYDEIIDLLETYHSRLP